MRVSLVEAPATDPVLRLAHHVALTDFAATYLALGSGLRPVDVAARAPAARRLAPDAPAHGRRGGADGGGP